MNEGANLNRLVDPAERVIELLAIKLFEHAPTHPGSDLWLFADEGVRDRYRRMARGEEPLP